MPILNMLSQHPENKKKDFKKTHKPMNTKPVAISVDKNRQYFKWDGWVFDIELNVWYSIDHLLKHLDHDLFGLIYYITFS